MILVLGLGMRCARIGAKSLWYDEAISAASLNFSYAEIIERKSGPRSVHPPLYFVLLKAWAEVFGDSEIALRSLAVVCGGLTIVGMYAFARALCRLGELSYSAASRVGLWTAFLMAVSPLQILSSQQVRGYSLGTALFAWSGWALVLALQESGRRRGAGWLLWAVLTVLFCYTSSLAVLSVAGQVVFAGCVLLARAAVARRVVNGGGAAGPVSDDGEPERRAAPAIASQWGWAALAGAVVLLAYGVPWGARLWSQSTTVRTTTAIVRPLKMHQLPQEVHRSVVGSWATKRSRDHAVIWLTTALAGSLLVYTAVRGGKPGWYLLLTGALPVALIVLFSAVSNRSIVQARYFTFAQPMWLAAFAFVLFRSPWRVEQALLGGWVVLNSAYLCYANWDQIGPVHEEGMRGAVRYALANQDPGEPLIALERHAFFGMQYYARDRSARWLLADRIDRSVLRAGNEIRDADLITPALLLDQQIEGAWVFTTPSYSAPQAADFVIPDCWELVETKSFAQDYFWEQPVIVQHYRFPASGPRCEDSVEARGTAGSGPERPGREEGV